eukprot:scaffold210690_cov31-Tisochrysis_lutea.AAC.3
MDFTPPFKRISMISGLEEKLGVKFPMPLESDEANEFLKQQVTALLVPALHKEAALARASSEPTFGTWLSTKTT